MSKIEVNTVRPQCGTTVTLGGSGETVALGTGASQTGFGRTGTVDWCTTAKTAGFTAASGKGYFVNTCGGAITVILPLSPSAGDIVSLADYKNTWAAACKSVTVCRNSSLINGGSSNATLSTEGQSITLVYVDGTRGWKNTMDSTSNVTGEPSYVTATGGNATITCGDYKTHIFTGTGPLNVTAAGKATGSNVAEYFVIAGGAGGGAAPTPGAGAGAGGAGGFRMFTTAPGSNSPLNAPAGLAVPVQDYTITVGAGGAAHSAPHSGYTKGNPGTVSTFSTITSAGGGGGGGGSPCPAVKADPGGSGGGGGYCGPPGGDGGTGNDPPTSPSQGNPGGTGPGAGCTPFAASGGGGAATAGVGWPGYSVGGAGGSGSYLADPFIGPTAPSYGTPGPTGSTRYFAGGGGGAGGALAYSAPNTGGAGGDGGGGAGGSKPNTVSPAGPPAVEAQGCAGAVNTGGGSGGNMGATCVSSTSGGSGIVMIRYKYQN